MCTGAEHLTPAARLIVANILGEIAARLAVEYACDPADIMIGPVDLGPPADGGESS